MNRSGGKPDPAGIHDGALGAVVGVPSLQDAVLTIYEARHEPETDLVHLHAEAKTRCTDFTTVPGLVIGFFVNGRRLTDLPTDDYGLATLDQPFLGKLFRPGTNRLTLRVKGVAIETNVDFDLVKVVKPEPVAPPAPAPRAAPPPPVPDSLPGAGIAPEKPLPPAPPVEAAPLRSFEKLAGDAARREEVHAQARTALSHFDYDRAVLLLETLPTVLRDPALHLQAVRLRDAVRALDEQLGEALRDGSQEGVYALGKRLQKLLPNNLRLSQLLSSLPPVELAESLRNAIGMRFTLIPPGRFLLGDVQKVPVTFTRFFYLGSYAVTQKEWKRVMRTEPWKGSFSVQEGDNFPAVHVNWAEALEFCRLLTNGERRAGLLPEGWEYTLPTEAQWEYACRAGTTTTYSFGDITAQLSEFAWYRDNTLSEPFPHEVGLKRPNPWGLFDMHGNVWEWCRDIFMENPAMNVNSALFPRGSNRVFRGGAWRYPADSCRTNARERCAPNCRYDYLGFRIVRARTNY